MMKVESIRLWLSGVLHYSPKLLGDRVSEKWWLTIKCDTGLADYYRHLYHLSTYRCEKIQAPSWREHVTLIRNEEPPIEKQCYWEKHEGKVVEFSVIPEIQTNGEYYWFPAEFGLGHKIREELGLGEPFYPFHFSIGHTQTA